MKPLKVYLRPNWPSRDLIDIYNPKIGLHMIYPPAAAEALFRKLPKSFSDECTITYLRKAPKPKGKEAV